MTGSRPQPDHNAARRLREITADLILIDGKLRRDCALWVDEAGRIARAGPRNDPSCPAATEKIRYEGALVPGAVNAHSHAFQVLLRGRSDAASGFRDWVDNYLYPLSLNITAEELELDSTLAFAEMVKNGVTTVGEFFYVHNEPRDPVSGSCAEGGNTNSRLVVAAARRVGLRTHLLRCLYDRAAKVGQRRFYEPADVAIEATRELRDTYSSDQAVTVSIAPHSLHGATAEGIAAAAQLAAELDRPFQIHIAEEAHDVDFARQHYGTTPGRVLEKLGVVSERLCVVHGVWLDGEEIAMLGQAGAKLAYNPISNMALGDGITDIDAMIAAGVTVALGCDGPCANHQVNIWQEMRSAEWLQRVDKLRMNVVTPAAADRAETANYCLEMGTSNGGEVLGLKVGRLAPGYWADCVVVDTNDLSLLPHHDMDPEALLHNIVNAMAARGAIRHVMVAGQEILRDGRLTLIDEPELAEAAGRWSFTSPPG